MLNEAGEALLGHSRSYTAKVIDQSERALGLRGGKAHHGADTQSEHLCGVIRWGKDGALFCSS